MKVFRTISPLPSPCNQHSDSTIPTFYFVELIVLCLWFLFVQLEGLYNYGYRAACYRNLWGIMPRIARGFWGLTRKKIDISGSLPAIFPEILRVPPRELPEICQVPPRELPEICRLPPRKLSEKLRPITHNSTRFYRSTSRYLHNLNSIVPTESPTAPSDR